MNTPTFNDPAAYLLKMAREYRRLALALEVEFQRLTIRRMMIDEMGILTPRNQRGAKNRSKSR